MQLTLDVHDTPLSTASVMPAGTRTRCADQLIPFQRAAIGSELYVGAEETPPTATHLVIDAHQTSPKLIP